MNIDKIDVKGPNEHTFGYRAQMDGVTYEATQHVGRGATISHELWLICLNDLVRHLHKAKQRAVG